MNIERVEQRALGRRALTSARGSEAREGRAHAGKLSELAIDIGQLGDREIADVGAGLVGRDAQAEQLADLLSVKPSSFARWTKRIRRTVSGGYCL